MAVLKGGVERVQAADWGGLSGADIYAPHNFTVEQNITGKSSQGNLNLPDAQTDKC